MTGSERRAVLEATINADRAREQEVERPAGSLFAAALVYLRELLLITALPGLVLVAALVGFEVIR